MSKLDRELKDVMDDAFAQGEALIKALLPLFLDDEIDEDEKMQKLGEALEKSKPKTYDDYIHDIKRAFIDDGWKRAQS